MSDTRPSASVKPRYRVVWILGGILGLGAAAGWYVQRAKGSRSRPSVATPAEPSAEEKCDAAGWCRQATGPNVSGQFIRGVWAHSAHDVWLVDFDGFLGHWDGKKWGVQRLPKPGSAIWGFGSRELWVTGNHAVLQGDGTTWKTHELPYRELEAIHGTSPEDMWVTATWAGVFHYDGQVWTKAQLGKHGFEWFSAVHAVGKNDVWLAGGPVASIFHFDGKEWTLQDLPSGGTITGLWAAAPNDVWAVGCWGRLIHYDGKSWKQVASPAKRGLDAVWGSNAHDVWAVGEEGAILHYDGIAWVLDKVDWRPLKAVAGTPDQELWAVGLHGRIVHWHGRGWKPSVNATSVAQASSPSVGSAGSHVAAAAAEPDSAALGCPDFVTELKKGRQATLQRKYQEAYLAFDAAIRARPLDATARAERGYAYLLAGEAARALEDLGRADALTAAPGLLRQIWYNLGLAFDKLGKTEKSRVAFAVAVHHGSEAAKTRLGDGSRCTALVASSPPAEPPVAVGLETLASRRQHSCKFALPLSMDENERWHRGVCVDCGGADRCRGERPALVPSGARDRIPMCFLMAPLGSDEYFYENATYCTQPPKVEKQANLAVVTTNVLGPAADEGRGWWTIDGLFYDTGEDGAYVDASGHWSDERPVAGDGGDGCTPSLQSELPLGKPPTGTSGTALMPQRSHRRVLVYSLESHRVVLSLHAYTADVRVRVVPERVTVTGGGCEQTIQIEPKAR